MKTAIATFLFALGLSSAAMANHGSTNPYGPGYKPEFRTCAEGQIFRTTETGANGKQRPVNLQCVRGKWINPYAAPQGPVQILRCVENTEQLMSEPNGHGKYDRVWEICRNGMWERE